MIRPEGDPHWLLGVEHGRDGLEIYRFADAENQRRYLEGYDRGRIQRQALLADQQASSLGQQLGRMQQGPLGQLAYGGSWKP